MKAFARRWLNAFGAALGISMFFHALATTARAWAGVDLSVDRMIIYTVLFFACFAMDRASGASP